MSEPPRKVYDVQLLVQDPVSSFPATRFRRVEAETATKAGNLARRVFNKSCAPIRVDTWDALLEVARAARELLESRLWKSDDGSESWQKANNLAAALARLDKDTA